MEAFFENIHQQAKAAIYSLESAVTEAVAPTTKRKTTTVRQPFLLAAAPADTERLQEVEDSFIGSWAYGEPGSKPGVYRICSEGGKLIFREGKRKGTLASSCDSVSLVAKLVRPNGNVHGSIKLRTDEKGQLISNFRPHGSTLWGDDIIATRKDASKAEEELDPTATPRTVAARSQKSRVVQEEDKKSLKHAKTAPPQELHFIAPEDCTPGSPVCLSGPHGDPIVVPMPEGAEPGMPCRIYLGPKSTIQVVVPEGASPGSVVLFTCEDDGEMLHTVVPNGKKPGDTFDIVPPVVIIQVPKGAKEGEEVLYTTPQGTPAVVQIPAGFSPGHYFPTLLPVAKDLAAIALKQANGVPQARKASTLDKVVSDAKKTVQGDAQGHRNATTVSIDDANVETATRHSAAAPSTPEQVTPEKEDTKEQPAPVPLTTDDEPLTPPLDIPSESHHTSPIASPPRGSCTLSPHLNRESAEESEAKTDADCLLAGSCALSPHHNRESAEESETKTETDFLLAGTCALSPHLNKDSGEKGEAKTETVENTVAEDADKAEVLPELPHLMDM